MSENRRNYLAWFVIIIIGYLLWIRWIDEGRKNEENAKIFAQQTVSAVKEKIRINATQLVLDDLKNCYRSYAVPNKAIYEYSVCVIGFIRLIEEYPSPDPTIETFYLSYFEDEPIGFHLYGDVYLGQYLDDCVVVRGGIRPIEKGPRMLVIIDDRTIIRLPDDACFQ